MQQYKQGSVIKSGMISIFVALFVILALASGGNRLLSKRQSASLSAQAMDNTGPGWMADLLPSLHASMELLLPPKAHIRANVRGGVYDFVVPLDMHVYLNKAHERADVTVVPRLLADPFCGQTTDQVSPTTEPLQKSPPPLLLNATPDKAHLSTAAYVLAPAHYQRDGLLSFVYFVTTIGVDVFGNQIAQSKMKSIFASLFTFFALVSGARSHLLLQGQDVLVAQATDIAGPGPGGWIPSLQLLQASQLLPAENYPSCASRYHCIQGDDLLCHKYANMRDANMRGVNNDEYNICKANHMISQ